jgi:Cu+-exporting ATPase
LQCKHCNRQTKNTEFCNDKCESIFKTLQSKNLNSFYSKLGNHTIPKGDASNQDINFDKFDSLSFEEEFISKDKNGNYQSYFYISGITCSACVWLNESVLLKQDGIISANINIADKKAKVVWDIKKIKVSDIIKLIYSIGYEAHPYTRSIASEEIKKEKKNYIAKLWVAFFASFNIMMVDVAKYKGIFTFIEDDVKFVFHMAEFFLSSLTIFYSGSLFLKKAYAGAKNKIINMEFLVYFGAMLGYVYSLWVLFLPISELKETYFDSVTMIISFVLLGKYLEIIARENSTKELSKISNIPMMINTINKDNQITPKLSRLIQKDDLISIKPNETIIIDGIIVSGKGNFNTSIINGESKEVFKKENSDLISGSVSIDANIIYKATTNSKNSFLGKLSNIIQNENITKSKYEESIAKVSSYFGIVIIALAFLSFIGWYFINQDFTSAIIIAISVIVIACPCSLALAIPISTVLSLNALVKKNIICKNPSLLGELYKSKYFVFDKTNTLTYGKFEVLKHNIPIKYMSLIYQITKKSNHLISKSISQYIKNNFKDLKDYQVSNYQVFDSLGLKAKINNKYILAGNKLFLEKNGINTNNIEISSSVLLIAINNSFIGYFQLEDKLKEEAKEVIQKLKQKNINQIIISGDNEAITKKISNQLGIPYKANMSLEDKKQFIQDLQKNQIVTMVGDGLNDVLALNQSDVSISFTTSETITIKSSDILLNNQNLKSIIHLINISKKYKKLIKQNIILSLAYNALTIPLAIMGYVTPLISAISMSLSSILVVLNSIIRMKFNK